jgi:hypothetical protein
MRPRFCLPMPVRAQSVPDGVTPTTRDIVERCHLTAAASQTSRPPHQARRGLAAEICAGMPSRPNNQRLGGRPTAWAGCGARVVTMRNGPAAYSCNLPDCRGHSNSKNAPPCSPTCKPPRERRRLGPEDVVLDRNSCHFSLPLNKHKNSDLLAKTGKLQSFVLTYPSLESPGPESADCRRSELPR